MNRMKKTVAALGDNCVDIYLDLDLWYCTGNVVDFGVHMQRLGIPVSIITTTGNDSYGNAMREMFQREKLDTSHLKIAEGNTARSYMKLIDKERIYDKWDGGVMDTISFSEEDIAFAKSHDLVHSAMWGNAHMHLPEIHSSGTLTSFDYADEFLSDGSDIFEQTIEHVDFAFFSFERDKKEVRDFLQRTVARGPRLAVATFGSEGRLAWDGTVFIHCGIMPSDLVNTIGAGDSYIAGFMHGILSGMGVADCMTQGARVAAETVSVFGPWPEKE